VARPLFHPRFSRKQRYEDHENEASEAKEHIDRSGGEEQDARHYEGASPEDTVVEMLVALVHRQAG
jgi:hypothetical protein